MESAAAVEKKGEEWYSSRARSFTHSLLLLRLFEDTEQRIE